MSSIQKVTTPTNAITRRDFLGSAFATTGMLTAPWLGIAAAKAQIITPDQRQRIEKAIPNKAFVQPRRWL